MSNAKMVKFNNVKMLQVKKGDKMQALISAFNKRYHHVIEEGE